MSDRPLKKLMIVDDDKDTLKITQFCLRSLEGIEVQYLESGEEALQVALDFHPDLILLDVNMPKMSGIDTLQALRLIPSLVDIPVVFLTAKVMQEEVRQLLEYQGVIDVITKPFDPLNFASQVQQIWEKISA